LDSFISMLPVFVASPGLAQQARQRGAGACRSPSQIPLDWYGRGARVLRR
jgi:hypothetical protein